MKYEGEFKSGKAFGIGVITYKGPHEKAGYKYIGEIKDDKMHGEGIEIYQNEIVREGLWENGILVTPQNTTIDFLAEARGFYQKEKPRNTEHEDIDSGLETIKRLLDKGLITEGEATKKRAEILSKIK
jgi:hypothetical protein